MPDYRYRVGTTVLCNMGPDGWKLGRIIALEYREDDWPLGEVAPYQVMLEAERELIYVPVDDPGYCREATSADLRIAGRTDALAPLPKGAPDAERTADPHCCGGSPVDWGYAEIYSEHYRCGARGELPITRIEIDLGTLAVGDAVSHRMDEALAKAGGFLQAPTLVRLPPGLVFADDGSLEGTVRFDPHREPTYRVEFVAVSTTRWADLGVGIVRLEIRCAVQENHAPEGFDADAFKWVEQGARNLASHLVDDLGDAWELWEDGELDNRETCERMGDLLKRLREALEQHPRLDRGKWWAHLGGYHMNVHKLLENKLFECELYLGYALTFGDVQVRRQAEQNLEGCYQKHLLEAARYRWMDGLTELMNGAWGTSVKTFQEASAKKDGWGWAVNYGDIWLSEAVARLLVAADSARGGGGAPDLSEVKALLSRCAARAEESGVFGLAGHPWATEVSAALREYEELSASGANTAGWLAAFEERTTFWCAQVLAGAEPFPPKIRPRLEEAAALVERLPGHNE